MASEGSQARVSALLKELHQVLASADDLDDSSKEALLDAAEQIEETLEGETTLDALRERIARFEGSHPTLTEAVRRVVDQLSDMGI